MRYWLVGKDGRIVWCNWFLSRAAAIRWRDAWEWGRGCKVVSDGAQLP